MEVILNGQAHGSIASTLLANNFDIGALRPYIGEGGRSFITQNVGGKQIAVPTHNAATLRKDEWIELDQVVTSAAKERLRLVSDLRGAGLQYNMGGNGMGRTVLQTQNISDITPAKISMEPGVANQGDRPEFDLTNLPLPVIHHGFEFHARQLATSRNSGTPLDTTVAALAGRRVAEMAEQLALGTAASFTYGGGTVYGLLNFPSRITKSDLADPTDSGWVPGDTVRDVLAMRQLSVNAKHYGPWVLYNSPAWDEYLDDDYSGLKGDNTLRERIAKINGIRDIRTLDYMTGFNLVLVQQTTDVIRMVVGMEISTLQWETNGGLTQNFKVMAILVPQLRADFNGNTGIVHGSVA